MNQDVPDFQNGRLNLISPSNDTILIVFKIYLNINVYLIKL